MSVLKNLPESLHDPLKSFVKELSSHVEFLQNIAISDSSTDEEIELARKKLEGRFHLIRGGAGFFKLDSLRTLATIGEEKFKSAKNNTDQVKIQISEFLPSAKADVKKVYEELKAELKLS